MPDEVDQTQTTYNRIADTYAQATRDRRNLQPLLAQFVALLPPQAVVLDVGCGPGFDTAVLRRRGLRAIGIDYTHAMMRAGRKQLNLAPPCAQADMRQLPIRSGIDGIWCCAALLHLPRAQAPATLQGFHRILRADGLLCLSVKQGEGSAWTQTSYGHPAGRFFTYWHPDELNELLTLAGFVIVNNQQSHGKANAWITRFARKKRP